MYANTTDYEDCNVIEFTNGSIIITYSIMFKADSQQNVSSVEIAIYEELIDPSGAFNDGNYTFDNSSLRVQGKLCPLSANPS